MLGVWVDAFVPAGLEFGELEADNKTTISQQIMSYLI